MIRGFLFDLDETIWSSEKAIINTIKQTILDKNGANVNFNCIKRLLRNNFTFKDVLKKYRVDSLSHYWSNYRSYIGDIKLFFPETSKVFDVLKMGKKKIGFVTSLKKEFSISLLKKFQLYNYADAIITPTECRIPKPNPSSLIMAIRELNLNPNQVIYIGDAENDISAAKNAGCLSGLAKWGNYQSIITNINYTFNDLREILDLA